MKNCSWNTLLGQTPRPGSGYNNRVNNNDFVWRLIEYGFRARNEQDRIQIREYVPNQFMADFENGLGII